LASTPAGLEIIEKANPILSNLFIAKSGVAENAGNGLYIVATTSPIHILKKPSNHLVQWQRRIFQFKFRVTWPGIFRPN
jgi:hypothetical protein